MKVSVFGNENLKEDRLAVRLADKLRNRFREIEFSLEDPSEGLRPPVSGLWVILDTAKGIDKVEIFNDLSKFEDKRRVSLHDYGLATELKLMAKLGKIKKLMIIAVPMRGNEKEILTELEKKLKRLVPGNRG